MRKKFASHMFLNRGEILVTSLLQHASLADNLN